MTFTQEKLGMRESYVRGWKKHAAAMLAAIEQQENDIDNASFKAKHMNLEQEMELM